MKKYAGIMIVLIFLISSLNAEEVKYTNNSFARVSYLSGNAYLQRASDLGYEDAVVNMPMAEGDRLGTTDGRAEIYLAKKNYIRLDNNTKIDLMNLPKREDSLVRVRVWAGNIYLNVDFLEKEKNFEIHTQDASLYILDKGLYRIDVRENGETELFVFRGLVEAAAEEGSILVKSEQRVEISEGRFTSRPSRFPAVAEDSFDRWSEDRDLKVSPRLASGYLPEELEDFEYELDEYGDWTYLPPYGNVWVPGGVDPGWRPYSFGRWVWLPLCGYTWLPYEPWGWCTYHFGRWHWGIGLGWYWIPTTIWGPAWVSWYWDYDYFAWAPLSYYGYPVVLIDNVFYDRYHGPYYPYNSRALTVIHKSQLKARNVSEVALRSESLKNLNNLTLTSQRLSLKPEPSRVRVEDLEGKRLILRNEDRMPEMKQENRLEKSSVRSPESLTPQRMEEKAREKEISRFPEERKIRKKDISSDSGRAESGGYIKRDSSGYPPSPEISIKKLSKGDKGSKSGSFIDRVYKYISGGSSSSRGSSPRATISKGSSSQSGSRGTARTSSRGSSSRSGSRSGTVKKRN